MIDIFSENGRSGVEFLGSAVSVGASGGSTECAEQYGGADHCHGVQGRIIFAMSVARPEMRALALVAFAVLVVCRMDLQVVDEGAMHPRWAI